MVNLSVADKVIGKVDTRKNEGKIKERLAQLKAAERKYQTSKEEFGPQISNIKKEMNEILTTGKLSENPLSLPSEQIVYQLSDKNGKLQTVSKKKMEHFLETATPEELTNTVVNMQNAPQHMLDKAKFATDKLSQGQKAQKASQEVDVTRAEAVKSIELDNKVRKEQGVDMLILSEENIEDKRQSLIKEKTFTTICTNSS